MQQTVSQVGDLITWQVKVTNNGPSTASGVSSGLTFSAGQAYSYSVASKGSFDNSTNVWEIGQLGPSEEVTLTLGTVVTDDTVANWTVDYTVAGGNVDPFLANNSIQLVVAKTASPSEVCCESDQVDLSAPISGSSASNVQEALVELYARPVGGGGPGALTTISLTPGTGEITYIDEQGQSTVLDLKTLGWVASASVLGNVITLSDSQGNSSTLPITINAPQVPFTSTGDLTSTDVASALDELNSKVNSSGGTDTGVYVGSGTVPSGTVSTLGGRSWLIEDPDFSGGGVQVVTDAGDQDAQAFPAFTTTNTLRAGFILRDANDANILYLGLSDEPGTIVSSVLSIRVASEDFVQLRAPAINFENVNSFQIDNALSDADTTPRQNLVWNPNTGKVIMEPLSGGTADQELHTFTATGGETSTTHTVASGTPYAVILVRQGAPAQIETLDYSVSISGSTVTVNYLSGALISGEAVQFRILTR